jgi:hypothetical protein
MEHVKRDKAQNKMTLRTFNYEPVYLREERAEVATLKLLVRMRDKRWENAKR